MTGKKVKEILKKNGYKLNFVAEAMGEIPQNLDSLLKVKDIKTGVLERIAKAIDKDLSFFFNQGGGENHVSGNQSISGHNNTISGNVNITLPEKGYQKIIRSDGSQTTVEVASSNMDIETSSDLADENRILHKEISDLKSKIIELQGRLLKEK